MPDRTIINHQRCVMVPVEMQALDSAQCRTQRGKDEYGTVLFNLGPMMLYEL